jgi:LacI family transcriptional regulator
VAPASWSTRGSSTWALISVPWSRACRSTSRTRSTRSWSPAPSTGRRRSRCSRSSQPVGSERPRSADTATGCALPLASEPFAGDFVRGATAVAQEHDHLLLIGETEDNAWLERDILDGMLDRQIDGLVFPSMFTRVRDVPPLAAAVPVVLLNRIASDAPFPSVVPDEYEAGRTAVCALLDAGHRDGIQVVGERPRHIYAARERMRGIRAALSAAGARLGGAVDCRWLPRDGYSAVCRLLTRTRPTALICLNDRIAFGAYQALQAADRHIPRDVSVVSFDDPDLASWLRPQLASVALPHFTMGRAAVELLVKGERGPTVHRVAMPLRARASVGPPAP